MNAMHEPGSIQREESILRLTRVVCALAESARRCARGGNGTLNALRGALAARCVRCGTRVNGDELLALCDSEGENNQVSARIARLRQGCCVHEGCGASHYTLIFKDHPDLDWAELFSTFEGNPETPESTGPDAGQTEEEVRKATQRTIAIRVGILIVAALLLYVFHQCYYGGRIPLLRQPEHFRVAPAAPGAER